MSKSGAVVASDMVVMDMAILVPVLVMDLSVDMGPTDMAPTDMADICTVLVHSMVASPFHYTRRVKYFLAMLYLPWNGEHSFWKCRKAFFFFT